MSKKNSKKRNVGLLKPMGWTVKDLMNQTGLARQTIYNKVSQGKFPKRKRWGSLYFYPDEIIKILEDEDKPRNL